MNERVWHVKSQSGCNPEGYSVSLVTAVCSECSVQQDRHDLTICKAPECQFLCAHMYKCDDACYDFNNGHLCKHKFIVFILLNVHMTAISLHHLLNNNVINQVQKRIFLLQRHSQVDKKVQLIFNFL